jgi:hypothetical protein
LEGQRTEIKTAARRFFYFPLPSKEENMFMTRILTGGVVTNRSTLLLLPALFLGFFITSGPGTALAVSPMPSEIEKDQERKSMEQVKPTANNIVCKITIVYTNGKQRKEDHVSSIAMEATTSRKDALEKAIKYFEDRLHGDDVAEVAVDCRFPASGQAE